MDTATHQSSSTVSNPSLFNISSHHNLSHGSPRPRRYHYPHPRGGFHVPVVRKPQQFNTSPGPASSGSIHPSPGLLPLIYKFEDLDADSLMFNIRDAQPPHLRLPGSRMGGRDQRADLQQLKTTRERLLTLFDKPGWGARTLRALRDGDGRKFDENPFDEERRPSRTQRHASLKGDESPEEEHDREKWIPIARPRLRRESRIRERIEFFNSGIDFPPFGNHSPSRLKVADGIFSSQAPTRPQQIDSPTKPGPHSVFPPNHNAGALTPIKSYGYLRPKETTPLPWRPLDSRRWETADHWAGIPDTPKVRGRPREQIQHSLIIPTPTAAASAVKKVQITHQNAKRIVSEKLSVFHVTSPKERDQERFKYEKQSKGTSSALAQHPEAISDPKLVTNQDTNGERVFEAKTLQEINRYKSGEEAVLAKGSRLQDRASTFSNDGANASNFTLPTTRMRNQSTPTKLPSQAAYIIPLYASSRLPRLKNNDKLQAGECSAEVKTSSATSILASNVLLEAIADEPCSKLHDVAPRKSSGISDKIQHFESFAGGHADSIGKVLANNSNHGKFPSPQSKRIHTWPIPESDYVLNLAAEQTMAPENSTGRTQIRHGFPNHKINKNSPIPNSIKPRNDMPIKTYEVRGGSKQKVRARQERLTRRTRSRSRSAPGMSGPATEQENGSRASGQVRQAFEAVASMETRRIAAGEVGQQSRTALLLELDATTHQQHLGAERVHEIWVDGSEDGPPQEVVVMDTVVAQCELAEPRPMRVAETLRMIRLCRGRFGERSGTRRRKLGRTSEKGGGLAA